MQKEYSQEKLDNMLKKYTGLPDPRASISNNKTKKIIRRQPVVTKQEDYITNVEIKVTEKQNKIISIPIISLISWIKKRGKLIPPKIKILDFNITGISNDEYLLVKVPHPKGGEISTGIEKKELLMFKNANKIPVLDLDVSDMVMYNSGIKMIHPFNGGFIKCYTGKSNYLVASMANDQLIPYHITKIKNNNLLIYKENEIDIEEVIKELADKEKIKTLYNIILKEKSWKYMRTNGDIINYFLSIQKNIKDNTHHIKIDNIMIGMLTGVYPANQNLATHVSYQLQYL